MLSTLLVWSITDPMNAAAMNTQDPDTKFRFPTYSLIVKKLRVNYYKLLVIEYNIHFSLNLNFSYKKKKDEKVWDAKLLCDLVAF